MKQVLFLCTGNYYRSRFAEHLFNWFASQGRLPWRADSRGLALSGNVGPISQHAVDALKLRGIPVNGTHRFPEPLILADLRRSELVVAVKEAEHRPLMAEQFPDWADRLEYWDVDDLDCETAEVALPYLEEKVRTLVARLRSKAGIIPARVFP